MNIHCFGCSWTFDMHGVSWPAELSKLLPDHDIYNYGYPGSDLLYSLYCMHEIEKTDNDLFIFQGTGVGRLSTWEHFNPKKFLIKTNRKNYMRLDNVLLDKEKDMRTMTPNTTDNKKLQKLFYGYLSAATIEAQYDYYIDYAKLKADYVFTQKRQQNNTDCFMQEIGGMKKYRQYVIDGQGLHFGYEGCKMQAQWIHEKIKDKINVVQ